MKKQELINQIINQLENLSLESMRLTQELKALQDTTGTTTKNNEKITCTILETEL